MDSFILLGDSLFQRASSQDRDQTGQVIGSLQPRLSDAYVRRLDVVNRGFSGYNTRQILEIQRNVACLPGKAHFVAILLGANDARLPDTPGGPQQHVPLVEFKKNLARIVRRLRLQGSRKKRIILITTPPVDERMTVTADSEKDTSLRGVIRRKAAVTAQYARAVREVGEEHKITVLDLWSKFIDLACRDDDGKDADSLEKAGRTMSAEGVAESSQDEHFLPGSSEAPVNKTLQSYFIDGLHFSRKGYDLFYDELMTLIATQWPDDTPDRLPMIAPAWDAPGKWVDMKVHNSHYILEFPEYVWWLTAFLFLGLMRGIMYWAGI